MSQNVFLSMYFFKLCLWWILGNIQISHVVSATNPTLTIDLAGVAKGIQTVSLFVDGNLVDSRNIVTK